jgi:hypothetical protein
VAAPHTSAAFIAALRREAAALGVATGGPGTR